MTDHPFEVGGKYRNRRDNYEVIPLSGEKMRVRYGDGTEQTLTISKQIRIWENIQAEQGKKRINWLIHKIGQC